MLSHHLIVTYISIQVDHLIELSLHCLGEGIKSMAQQGQDKVRMWSHLVQVEPLGLLKNRNENIRE